MVRGVVGCDNGKFLISMSDRIGINTTAKNMFD
jgi:hypothetical protein